MSSITAEKTVAELVVERPGRSRVFEEYGIDYCCGGGDPLSEACTKKGLEVDEIMTKLTASDAAGTQQDDGVDYATMPLADLIDHIVSTHHAYLVRELPRLLAMSAKVASVHGDSDERLGELAKTVQALADELNPHMMKEENILFPFICQLEQSDSVPNMPFGTLANPIGAMIAEHDNAGEGLASAHSLTDGYTPPDWACNTYRALLDALSEFEQDLHQHIHKENNILFPRALELEKQKQ